MQAGDKILFYYTHNLNRKSRVEKTKEGVFIKRNPDGSITAKLNGNKHPSKIKSGDWKPLTGEDVPED